MPQIDRLMEGLRGLLDHIDLADGDLSARLAETVDAARDLLDADGAGLMLLGPDGRLALAGASGEDARAMELAQERLNDGPGVESTRLRMVVSVNDLASDPRWPQLSLALADTGVRSVLAAPIWLRGHPAGNLNLMGTTPREWSRGDGQALAAYAGVVTAFLRIALDAGHRDPLVARLQASAGFPSRPT